MQDVFPAATQGCVCCAPPLDLNSQILYHCLWTHLWIESHI